MHKFFSVNNKKFNFKIDIDFYILEKKNYNNFEILLDSKNLYTKNIYIIFKNNFLKFRFKIYLIFKIF